jgi:Trypsin-like peptidase domain
MQHLSYNTQTLSQQKDDLPQFNDGTDAQESSNPLVDFWMKRTVKICVADASGTSDTMGTGIAINKYLILTNKHVVEESGASIKVLHQGRSIPVKFVLQNKGSLDLAFIVTSCQLSLPDEHTFVGRKIGLSPLADQAPVPGEKVYSIGFPNLNYSPDMHPFLTAGHLMKTYFYKDAPTLLHFSGLIFAGNSGGCILNSKGQLIGVVYANLELIASYTDKYGRDSLSQQKMTMNEMAFGICLTNECSALNDLLSFDKSNEGTVNKNSIALMLAKAEGLNLLSIQDQKLADAQALFSTRLELEKCIPEEPSSG